MPLTIFDGKFVPGGNQVVLKGTFHISLTTQLLLIVVLSLLTFSVALLGRVLIIDHNLDALTGITIVLAMMAFTIFILKSKTEDSPSDMTWIVSSIKSALQA